MRLIWLRQLIREKRCEAYSRKVSGDIKLTKINGLSSWHTKQIRDGRLFNHKDQEFLVRTFVSHRQMLSSHSERVVLCRVAIMKRLKKGVLVILFYAIDFSSTNTSVCTGGTCKIVIIVGGFHEKKCKVPFR